MFLLVFVVVAVVVYIIIDSSNNNEDRGYNEYQEKPPSLPESKIRKRHDEGEPKKFGEGEGVENQQNRLTTKSLV